MTDELFAYTVEEVAKQLRVHRGKVYEEIHAGRLRALRIGHMWRVPAFELRRFMEVESRGGRDAVVRRIGAA